MSQINKKMYSSDKMDWETPQALFDELNREFHFCLDAAASKENHKVSLWYTEEQDGLTSEWFNPTFCNPPYGRDVGKWCKKAYEESQRGVTSVLLLFARTDTAWFHDWVYGKAEIRFLRGRVTFVGADNPAPFPSMIVIYRGKTNECKYKRPDGTCRKLSKKYGTQLYCTELACARIEENKG